MVCAGVHVMGVKSDVRMPLCQMASPIAQKAIATPLPFAILAMLVMGCVIQCPMKLIARAMALLCIQWCHVPGCARSNDFSIQSENTITGYAQTHVWACVELALILTAYECGFCFVFESAMVSSMCYFIVILKTIVSCASKQTQPLGPLQLTKTMHAAYCLLPIIAYCLLPIAFYFAYCLLPMAYCLLSIAYELELKCGHCPKPKWGALWPHTIVCGLHTQSGPTNVECLTESWVKRTRTTLQLYIAYEIIACAIRGGFIILPILHIAYCLLLPIAGCLMPIAYCLLLPIAYCLLPIIAYCQLPIAYCLCIYSSSATMKINVISRLHGTCCTIIIMPLRIW